MKWLAAGIMAASLMVWFGASDVRAYGVAVTNQSILSQDTSANTITIEFDLGWSGYWRDATNRDAVWVFGKYSTNNGVTWSHLKLKTSGTNPTGFSQGSGVGVDIVVPTDKLGCIIEPASAGSGTMDQDDIQIVWDYGADSVSDTTALSNDTVIRLFAIEMVYVPQEGFYVGGDLTSTATAFFLWFDNEAGAPPQISSEEGIAFLSSSIATTGWTYSSGSNSGEDGSQALFNVSEAFPKGYQAFYMMKTEVPQGLYRDFLNTLTTAQQSARATTIISNAYSMVGTSTVTSRQAIKSPSGSGFISGHSVTFFGMDFDGDSLKDETTDGQWIAMNFMSWMDLAALADWAALRPMSEFEFEKGARGPIYPVSNEYAWGTTAISSCTSVSSSGTTNEACSSTTTNCHYNNAGIGGPIRVGWAARTSTTSDRQTAGGGYYGALDLSGNVWERVVTVGNSTGRSFSGTHGDGALTTAGNATNADWPGYSTSALSVTGAAGSGLRGGSWLTGSTTLFIADRTYAASADTSRSSDFGGRLVRTAG